MIDLKVFCAGCRQHFKEVELEPLNDESIVYFREGGIKYEKDVTDIFYTFIQKTCQSRLGELFYSFKETSKYGNNQNRLTSFFVFPRKYEKAFIRVDPPYYYQYDGIHKELNIEFYNLSDIITAFRCENAGCGYKPKNYCLTCKKGYCGIHFKNTDRRCKECLKGNIRPRKKNLSYIIE